MTEQRIAALERQVSDLQGDVDRLERRLESMLSRKGGSVDGQVHLNGWIQFEQQSSMPSTPGTDTMRVVGYDSGGVFQLVAIFPSGTTTVIAQE